MDQWTRIQSLAAAQHGHVAVAQAVDAGIPERTLRDLAARQAWNRPRRGVYRLPGAVPTPHGRLAADMLAVGPPVLVGGWSAAWLHGLVGAPPTTTALLVPHERKLAALPGVIVRRSRTIQPGDGMVVAGLPVTAPARTLCDLAALTEESALRALLIDARQRRLLQLPEVAERAEGMGKAKGVGMLRRLVWELDAERCDSVLEHRVRGRLRAAGFPPPLPAPVPVDVGGLVLEVDIGWPDRLVGIEVDGFGAHSERRSLEIDVRRHNALERVGWRILRAGWAEAGARFDALAADLRVLLYQLGSPPAASRRHTPPITGAGLTARR